MKKPCCEKFAEKAKIGSFAGVGYLYPESMKPTEQIEHDPTNDIWNVNGCCGGCYVLTGLKYCPWCGEKITKL